MDDKTKTIALAIAHLELFARSVKHARNHGYADDLLREIESAADHQDREYRLIRGSQYAPNASRLIQGATANLYTAASRFVAAVESVPYGDPAPARPTTEENIVYLPAAQQ